MGCRHQFDEQTVLDFGLLYVAVTAPDETGRLSEFMLHYTEEERKQLIDWFYERSIAADAIDYITLGNFHAPWNVVDSDDGTFVWFLGAGQRDDRKVYLPLSRRESANLANAMAQVTAFTPNDYQLATRLTANYYDKPIDAMMYTGIGLMVEAGKVADKVKKIYSEHNGIVDDKRAIVLEVGDLLWYAARLLADLDIDLEEAMQLNLLKLRSRMERGEGDER